MNILMTVKKELFPKIFDQAARSKLESLGIVTYRFDLDRNSSQEEYSLALKESATEVVVTGWDSPFLSYQTYSENPQLKYLCHVAGEVRPYVDNKVIEAGLIVSNWGDSVAKGVAEGTLMMILAALRRATFHQVEMHVRKGWGREAAPEGLFYQRVGLLGLGAIAREVVNLLKPFQCQVYAYDPFLSDEVFSTLDVVQLKSVQSLFETCRIISIHVSKLDENYHIVNRDILSRLEDGGLIINLARGSIIDTEALIAELKSGRIHAALDVFEAEPLDENSALRGLENCLLIPHQAGPTPDRWIDMGNLTVENIENYIAGRDIKYVVTPEKFKLMT
ncbi:MAG TPA: hydroxyacid dehydrogenase [bacterium]